MPSQTKRAGLLLDEVFQLHRTGPAFPENPQRTVILLKALHEASLLGRFTRLEPVEASRELMLSVHSGHYLDRLERACRKGRPLIDTPDCPICPDSYRVARLAAGGTAEAAVRVAGGELANAFCAVRPPGHHAERDRAMGFCLLNNIAVAAMRVKRETGLDRLLILDWDVHHGNGTQQAFEQEPDVLYVSLHQTPETLFPGTGYADERGRGAGEGATLNIPLPPGTGDREYLETFDTRALPQIESFRPEMVLCSVGFDTDRSERLAGMSLSRSARAAMMDRTLETARRHCGGRLLAVLEGGYDSGALAGGATDLAGKLLDACE